MKAKPTAPMNIDEYIAGFPQDVREILQEVLDKPIPFDLIRRIVRFRAKENLAGADEKRKK